MIDFSLRHLNFQFDNFTQVLYLFKWKVHSGGRNIYLEEHKQIHLKGFISLAIKYSIKHDQHKMMMSQYVVLKNVLN